MIGRNSLSLLDFLYKNKIIDDTQMQNITEEYEDTGDDLGSLLINHKVVTSDTLTLSKLLIFSPF